MNAPNKKLAPSVEDALNDLDSAEAWKPALIAFYQRDGCPQSAENLERGWAPLDSGHYRLIEALKAAFEVAP